MQAQATERKAILKPDGGLKGQLKGRGYIKQSEKKKKEESESRGSREHTIREGAKKKVCVKLFHKHTGDVDQEERKSCSREAGEEGGASERSSSGIQ